MTLSPLTIEESASHGGATHVANVTHADLTEATANTAQVIALATVADKVSVACVKVVLKTAFEDASDAAFNSNTITVGDGNDADELLVSMQVNANGTEVNQKTGTTVTHDYAAADTVDLTVNSMTAKSLSDLDAGEADIYLRIADSR